MKMLSAVCAWAKANVKQPKRGLVGWRCFSFAFVVDGEMFSWYGSRIKQSYKYFKELSQKLL
ncbi:MAG: hypothetical protein M9931_06945 [Chitinophagales bacterium]|nr:hypothetical protein [Chitinophagales bacterium]